MADDGREELRAEPGPNDQAELAPPERNVTSPIGRASGVDENQDNANRGRRSSAISRRSGSGIPSLRRRTTLTERTQGNFTLAGPEDISNLRRAHEPFVHPGYADLNPSYDQAPNTKPVWSLAKPLPRVVRPGMVPTKEELFENRARAQFPAENSRKEGLDVDPSDLEKGQIDLHADPRKIAAQVEDARLQRENNFVNKILSGDTSSTRQSRVSRTLSRRERRPSSWDLPQDRLSTIEERGPQEASYEPLLPMREESPSHSDEEVEQEPTTPGIQAAALPDDLQPLVQDMVEEEVYNNHTAWSVIRTHHREALAEALGVFVQLTIGFCADLAVTIAAAGNPNTTPWAWGFATAIGIYIAGGVSGAHLNPSVTVMLWFYRGFPKRKMPEYFAAQFTGAFCAGLTAYGTYLSSIQHYLVSNSEIDIINSFVTSQREAWMGLTAAFFNEFIGTTVLTVTLLALGDDQNAPPGPGMNSFVIGLLITCLSIAFGYQTGAALNPSRDFGPRLALLALGYPRELFLNPYWFYGPWAGSLTGAFTGAFLYDFMIFTGGESPVNYPLERTQRAMKKSRRKWKRRLDMAKAEVDNVIS